MGFNIFTIAAPPNILAFTTGASKLDCKFFKIGIKSDFVLLIITFPEEKIGKEGSDAFYHI